MSKEVGVSTPRERVIAELRDIAASGAMIHLRGWDDIQRTCDEAVALLSASSETAAIVQVLPLAPQPETITTSTTDNDGKFGGSNYRMEHISAPSAIAPSRETEYKRLLGEWLKKSEAHSPEIKEFKGGYQPFLERATRDFLAACERNEPEWP